MSNTNGTSISGVTFSAKKPGDCISDETLKELRRRMTVTVDFSTIVLSTVFSPTPPSNTNVVWQPTDPSTGAPVGGTKIWNPTTNEWVLQNNIPEPDVDERIVRRGNFRITADGLFSLVFGEAMPSTDYFIRWYFSIFDGTGFTLTVPPANDAIHWYLTAKGTGSFTGHFLKIPTGGIMFHWEVES